MASPCKSRFNSPGTQISRLNFHLTGNLSETSPALLAALLAATSTTNTPIRPSACSKDPTRRPRGASRTAPCAPRSVRSDSIQEHRQAPRTRRARASRHSSVRRHPGSDTQRRSTLRDDASVAPDAAYGAWPAWKVSGDGADRVVHRRPSSRTCADAYIRSGAGHSMANPPERRRPHRAPYDLVARGDGSTQRATHSRIELEA